MPVRVVLNTVYAMLTDGADEKERRRLDEAIYGWGDDNDRANRELNAALNESGGEG